MKPQSPTYVHWVTLSPIHPQIFNWGFGKRGRARVIFNLPDKLLEHVEGKWERAFPTWRGAQAQGRRGPAYLGCHQKTRRQEESFQTERGEGFRPGIGHLKTWGHRRWTRKPSTGLVQQNFRQSEGPYFPQLMAELGKYCLITFSYSSDWCCRHSIPMLKLPLFNGK